MDVGDDLVCDFRATVDLDGTFDGDTSDPQVGDELVLDVSMPGALGVATHCDAPFSTYVENSVVTTDSGLGGAPIVLKIIRVDP